MLSPSSFGRRVGMTPVIPHPSLSEAITCFAIPGSCGFVVWFSSGSFAKLTTKNHEHKTDPHEGRQVGT